MRFHVVVSSEFPSTSDTRSVTGLTVFMTVFRPVSVAAAVRRVCELIQALILTANSGKSEMVRPFVPARRATHPQPHSILPLIQCLDPLSHPPLAISAWLCLLLWTPCGLEYPIRPDRPMSTHVISEFSSWTGPHPELTVAAAVLVLLVVVIISLIVLVVIWKQVLPPSLCVHLFSLSRLCFHFLPC